MLVIVINIGEFTPRGAVISPLFINDISLPKTRYFFNNTYVCILILIIEPQPKLLKQTNIHLHSTSD